jgi:prevent-host-death family protein
MKQSVWQLQEAKNKLSELVEHALRQGPQIITRRGEEAVIVMSVREYHTLRLRQGKLSDFFRESPLAGMALDLKRDKRKWRGDIHL